MGVIQVYQSCKETRCMQRLNDLSFVPDAAETEMNLLLIYRDIPAQKVQGFGGAFTPASAVTFRAMNAACQQEILQLLFSPEGLRYSCGRVAIGACDFSQGNYAYCESEDAAGLDFSIAKDEIDVLPFLRAAQEVCPTMVWMASPWSPPSWMKTNGQMCGGGKLRQEAYDAYAEYLVRFLREYRQAGIAVDYLTLQNEPKAVQRWESCVYTAKEEEKLLLCVAEALKKADIQVKLVVWDHNKERVFSRAKEIFENKKAREATAGIAFHWYSGDHFENLSLCARFFPEMELIFTEGCVELTTTATTMAAKAALAGTVDVENAPWEFGECYGHDILGNLNNGMHRFLDWNVLLDQQGGPNHVGNYCSAPLICDTETHCVHLQPSYYYIAHFSRFITPGAQCIATSRFTENVEMAAFLRADGETVVVLMNTQEQAVAVVLKDVAADAVASLTLPAHSITTLVYNERI